MAKFPVTWGRHFRRQMNVRRLPRPTAGKQTETKGQLLSTAGDGSAQWFYREWDERSPGGPLLLIAKERLSPSQTHTQRHMMVGWELKGEGEGRKGEAISQRTKKKEEA